MKSRRFFEDWKKADTRSCCTLVKEVSGGKRCLVRKEGNVSNAPRQIYIIWPRGVCIGPVASDSHSNA